MGNFPLQGAFGILIMIGGFIFGLMQWQRARGRIGPAIGVIGGSLVLGAWIAKPDLYDVGKDRAGEVLDWAVHLGQGSS